MSERSEHPVLAGAEASSHCAERRRRWGAGSARLHRQPVVDGRRRRGDDRCGPARRGAAAARARNPRRRHGADALARLDGGGRRRLRAAGVRAPSASSSSGSRWAEHWPCGRRCTTPRVRGLVLVNPVTEPQPADVRAMLGELARRRHRRGAGNRQRHRRARSRRGVLPAHAGGAADLAARRRSRRRSHAATAS